MIARTALLAEIRRALKRSASWPWWARAAEFDLLLMKHGKRIGIEAKRADAPTLTPSMRIAIEDLRLDQLMVLYSGERQYALSEKVTVVPVTTLATLNSNFLWPRRRARKGSR